MRRLCILTGWRLVGTKSMAIRLRAAGLMFLILPFLSVLLLVGSLPLAAQTCDHLRAEPSDGSNFLVKPVTEAYRVSVAPGGPAFRVTIRPLLDHIETPLVHAGDIEIARCEDGTPVQVLPIRAHQPIHFAATFAARDINFDGYVDISVISEFAAKYTSRSYWVYDPHAERFVENELTRELSENCLGKAWHGGCWRANTIDFDSLRHEITAHYLIGVGNCGMPADRYRVEGGRLVVVHQEVLEMSPDQCTVTISDRSAGTMRITAVHHFDGKGTPRPGSGR